MYILSQDKDIIFHTGTVLYDECTKDETVLAYNIYGIAFTGRVLLGTYEEDEAEQIITEIFTLLKAGKEYYIMPESADNPFEEGYE